MSDICKSCGQKLPEKSCENCGNDNSNDTIRGCVTSSPCRTVSGISSDTDFWQPKEDKPKRGVKYD